MGSFVGSKHKTSVVREWADALEDRWAGEIALRKKEGYNEKGRVWGGAVSIRPSQISGIYRGSSERCDL